MGPDESRAELTELDHRREGLRVARRFCALHDSRRGYLRDDEVATFRAVYGRLGRAGQAAFRGRVIEHLGQRVPRRGLISYGMSRLLVEVWFPSPQRS
jgi:hypothetical protein